MKRHQTPEDLKDLQELNTRLINIQNLKRSEGWKLLEKTMFAHEQIAYNDMVDKNSTDRAAALGTGAYHALRNVRYWPDVEEKMIKQQMAMIRGEEVPQT